jgi:hypothetical protein
VSRRSILRAQKPDLLDELVGADEQDRRDFETERSGSSTSRFIRQLEGAAIRGQHRQAA